MSQFLAQCGVMGSLNRSAQNGLAIILKMNWIFADSYLNPIDENIDGKF
jgi:hypothetical protein